MHCPSPIRARRALARQVAVHPCVMAKATKKGKMLTPSKVIALAMVLSLASLASCAVSTSSAEKGSPGKPPLPVASAPRVLPASEPELEPSSTPTSQPPRPVLILGATVMTAAGDIHSPGWVHLENGRIAGVGSGMTDPPEGVETIHAEGLWLTPGIIDTHSHLGVYPQPSARAHADGNEMTGPNTAEVWAEHGFWPQDPGIGRALAAGVTTIQVLPGSANLIGGRSFVARTRPAVSARDMRFPGAPQGLKMACGENPKRVYGERRSAPMTRMGNAAGWRSAFQKAVEYQRKRLRYERDLAAWRAQHASDDSPDVATSENAPDPPEPPDRNLGLETLAEVLDGRILVQWHCYRADEMSQALDIASEFGFHIRSFHHAVEAYKLRDRLAREGVAVSTWADWWGFKMEAFDAVPQNAALLQHAGARPVIHSDSPVEIRWLNQEAAKAATAGRKIGIELDDDTILRWITANPAWVLGIDTEVGTLESGKRADLVLWDRHPFSIYARIQRVWMDGEVVHDASQPRRRSDFELGLAPEEAP